MVEGNVDRYGCSFPSSILVQPLVLTSIFVTIICPQGAIYIGPLGFTNIAWREFWVTNYTDKLFEAFVRFLCTAIPEPISKTE